MRISIGGFLYLTYRPHVAKRGNRQRNRGLILYRHFDVAFAILNASEQVDDLSALFRHPMKIAFIPGSCAPFHGKTLEERPLGGIETAVIRLASALDKMGHSVYVFSRFENPPLTKPLYLPLRAMEDLGDVDVMISVRELLPLFMNIRAKQRYYWTGDSYDQLQHLGLGDRRTVQRLDAALFVSDWQADALCSISGYPRERCYTLRNGVDPALFQGSETRNLKRLMYSSTPFRGLAHMPKLFKAIRNSVNDAELHIFSGFAVYEGSSINRQALDQQFAPLFDKLAALPGVTVHGNVRQSLLAREFMKSAILAYPNTFEETSCISAMEAMAGGCSVVTSDRGALPETLAGSGHLIQGMPGTAAYDDAFVERIVNLLQNSAALSAASLRALERAKSFGWDTIAAEFTEFIVQRAVSSQFGTPPTKAAPSTSRIEDGNEGSPTAV